MSVVCCKVTHDKIYIASDSITVWGHTQSKGDNINQCKLFKEGNLYVGTVGTAREGALLQLFSKTTKPLTPTEDGVLEFFSSFSDWKKKKTDTSGIDNSYIMIFEGKAFTIDSWHIAEITKYDAIGAGMDFALAALYLDNTVEKAVKVACELSIYCEEPIIKYIIEKKEI